MTLLRNGLNAIWSKAPNVERLPAESIVPGAFGLSGGVQQTSQLTLLNAYASIGWLFSVVSRITEGVAAAEWQLYRELEDEREEVYHHPALDLWEQVSPFSSRPEFLEASQQHFELVGEMWWVILRDRTGVPKELQLVRPDRMRPVPDRDDFISGYVYMLGNHRIPLDVEDVIFIKRPSPIDAYRGIGVVQSLLVDIGAEQAAAQWTRNFFLNSAEPGGIIEFDTTLSTSDFERLRERWNEQHRGVMNAHRVALLERGKWVDRKLSQRDMQFEQLRKLDREIILDAFGFPRPLMGITESSNRATAEAAEVVFSRWLIRPRLERIKGAINRGLIRKEYEQGLELDYIDPTPLDRELRLREAVEGYNAGILTQNEARARMGEGEVEEGDQFGAPAAPPSPFGLGVTRALAKAPSPERQMLRNWERRLADEASRVVEYLDQFKIELSDMAGFTWDWWERYGDEVIAELSGAFEVSIGMVDPLMDTVRVQRLAAEYAEFRASQLLRSDGEMNLARTTQARVQQLVGKTIDKGESLQTLQRTLRNDFVFSPKRAETVARTETATALGQGQKQVASGRGLTEKRWVTQGDDIVDAPLCEENEAQGWIAIKDPFQSGHDTIPAHENCRCTVIYRKPPGSDVDPLEGLDIDVGEAIAESRQCPTCHKRDTVVPNRDGPGFWCRRCNRTA